MFAAVGNDGLRPVVWGIGATEDEARSDAARWLADSDYEFEAASLPVHPITLAQASAVAAGDVSWPIEAK